MVKIHFWVSYRISFWRIIYAIQFSNYSLFKAHSCLIYLRKWRLKFHAALPESMTQCTSLIFKPRLPIVLLLVNTWELKFFHMWNLAALIILTPPIKWFQENIFPFIDFSLDFAEPHHWTTIVYNQMSRYCWFVNHIR